MNKLCVTSWALYDKILDEATCKVAFDCGSNEGGMIHPLLERGFEVHAFEPLEEEMNKAKDRYGDDPRITFNLAGLSDENKVMKDASVYRSWTIGQNLTLDPPEMEHKKFDIQLYTLDYYVKMQEIPQVGLIKIDVDGYEFRVLRGARETILRDKPPILIELSEYISLLGESIEEFINYIFGLGYRIHAMDGSYIASTWEEVEPYYPYHSSFDVMMLPK